MAKYIFRCIDNKLVACDVGDYCIGHSDFATDAYTQNINEATIYDDTVNEDIMEIDNIMVACAGMFEQIEVTE